MPETLTPTKNYYKRPSPLLTEMQRSLEVRQQIISDPLLGTPEVCKMLSCSYSHLRDLIHRKEIGIWRPHRRSHIRVRLSEVRRYIASGFKGEKQNG